MAEDKKPDIYFNGVQFPPDMIAIVDKQHPAYLEAVERSKKTLLNRIDKEIIDQLKKNRANG